MLGRDVEIGEAALVGRRGDLHEGAGPEVERLAFRQLEHDLADQRREHARRGDAAGPGLGPEDLLGDADIEVVAHRHLAGEPHALPHLAASELGRLSGQRRPRALEDGDPALPAGALAAAGGRHRHAAVAEDVEELGAGPPAQLPPLVDADEDGTGRQQQSARRDDDRRQHEHDRDEQHAAEDDLVHGSRTSTKAEKPIDMSPVTMKAAPSPCNPAGISE